MVLHVAAVVSFSGRFDENMETSLYPDCLTTRTLLLFFLQEYKVSNFEQRLMSEIEFRLERTPVEESDDEVQHDDIPTGKCIAPVFDKKLKNYKAMEGVPVSFTCKVLGVPSPKVKPGPVLTVCRHSPHTVAHIFGPDQVYWFKDGKQILKKNTQYQKLREGDGTCCLHIESTAADDDGNYTVMAANPQVQFHPSSLGPVPKLALPPWWPSNARSCLG